MSGKWEWYVHNEADNGNLAIKEKWKHTNTSNYASFEKRNIFSGNF